MSTSDTATTRGRSNPVSAIVTPSQSSCDDSPPYYSDLDSVRVESFPKKNATRYYFSEGGSFPVPSGPDSMNWGFQDEAHAWKSSLEALDKLLRGLLTPDHSVDACRECKLATLRQKRAEIERTREVAAIAGIEIPQYKPDAWTSRITLLLLRLRREGIQCLNEPTDIALAAIESEIVQVQRDIEEFGIGITYNSENVFGNMKIYPARFSDKAVPYDAVFVRGSLQGLQGERPDTMILDDVDDSEPIDQKKLFASLARDIEDMMQIR